MMGGFAGVEALGMLVKKIFKGSRGQAVIEYVFIISFIALAVIITLGALGIRLWEIYSSVTGSV